MYKKLSIRLSVFLFFVVFSLSMPLKINSMQTGASAQAWSVGKAECVMEVNSRRILYADHADVCLPPVFLPGESQRRQSLVGCCLWDRTESDTIEVT